MAYRILCISGGGVRGVIPSIAMEKLAHQIPDFRQQINLFAGTSTGALIALAVCAGIDPKEITSIYVNRAREIFKRTLWRTCTSLNGLVRARFDNDGLRKVLESMFPPNLKLGDLKHEVLIPSFRLSGPPEMKGRWHPVFFHNSPGSPYLNESVIDVALRATASPTYFPSYQGYIDGGVVANNPISIAIFHALGCGHALADLRVISLGTGYYPHELKGLRLDWGILQWSRHIVSLIIDGTMQVVERETSVLKHPPR